MASKAPKKLLGVDPASERKVSEILRSIELYPTWSDAKIAKINAAPEGLVTDLRAGKRLR